MARIPWLKERARRYWIALALGIITTVAVLGLWHQLVLEENLHIERLVQQQAIAIEAELKEDLTARILALQRMAKRWQVGGTTKAAWDIAAASNIEDFPGFQAIAWVDPSFQVRWTAPPSERETIQAIHSVHGAHHNTTFNQAKNLRQPQLTPSLFLPDGTRGFLAYIPLFVSDKTGSSDRQQFDGFILGVFQVQPLLDSILPATSTYQIQIYEQTKLIYSKGRILPSTPSKTVPIQVYGLEWQVQVAPVSLVAAARSPLLTIVLWGGVSFGWALACMVYLGQQASDQARKTRRINQQLYQEITSRQQAEQTVQVSETRYRQLIEHLSAGFVVHAADTRIVQCNAVACQLLGLSMEQLFGKVAVDSDWYFVREDGTVMPIEEYPVHRVLSTREALDNYVVGINRSNQSRVWVLVTAFPEFDLTHQLHQVVVTFIDISQLKHAESNLREMATVLENAVSGIAKLDAAGYYRYVNKAYATMAGYQPEEMLGIAWQQTVHPDDLMQATLAYQQMLQAGKVEVELKGVRQDRSNFYKQLVMISAYDEQQQFVGHYCFMKDISDRKLAEITKQALIESIPDFLVRLRQDGMNLEVLNRGAVQYILPDDKDIVGRSILETLPHPVAQERLALVQTALASGKLQTQNCQFDVNGTVIYEEARIIPLTRDEVLVVVRDMSERYRAEQSLRESEEKFRQLAENIHQVFFILSVRGDMLYISPAYEQIWERCCSSLYADPRSWLKTVHPDDLARVENAWNQQITQGRSFREIYRIVRSDGDVRWIAAQSFPLKDETGRVTRFTGIAEDITAQQQVEAALRQSEEKFRQLAENIHVVFWMSDPTIGQVLYVSPAYEEIWGYQCEELYQDFSQWLNAIHPEDRQHVQQAQIEDVYQGTYDQEYRIIRPDGSIRWIHDRGFPVKSASPDVKRIAGIAEDITAKKQAEAAMARLVAIVESSEDAIISQSLNGIITSWNAGAETIFGYTPTEMVGQPMALLMPEGSADEEQTILTQIRRGERIEPYDTQRCRNDGTLVDLSISISPIKNGNGTVIGASKIARDISDRKRKEVILQQAMEAAEAANLAKSMFLANMSHELRTPLNVILGFTQIMAHDVSLTPDQREDLQTIRRSGDHLLSLINDILDLSKIEAGYYTLEETGIDLVALLHTLRSMMTERAQAKHLQLILDIAPNVPQFVITDEQKLRQILLNLMSNAIKFTHQGSVTLQVSVQELTEKLDLLPHTSESDAIKTLTIHPNCRLRFDVIDTGVGIAIEEQNLIFDAFIQAEAGRKSVSGTGLGLTISRKLLELMHGTIAVSSTLSIGSTFTVTLPVCSIYGIMAQPEQHEHTVVGLAPGQFSPKILVVDDQSENRLLMMRLITQLGLEVREATNGLEALQIWQDWQPNLTWLDIRMPGLDGYEVARQIRAMERNQASIIIALTAQVSQHDRTLALAAGCNDYISKPFQEATVFLKMAEHLGLKYLYADAKDLFNQSIPDRSGTTTAPEISLPSTFTFSNLPATWWSQLEQATACGNDRAIVNLASHLSPEFEPLAIYLTELANQFQFEQILHWLYEHLPSDATN